MKQMYDSKREDRNEYLKLELKYFEAAGLLGMLVPRPDTRMT